MPCLQTATGTAAAGLVAVKVTSTAVGSVPVTMPERPPHCRSSTMGSPLRVPSSWRIPLRMLAPSSSRRSVGRLEAWQHTLVFCIPRAAVLHTDLTCSLWQDGCFAAVCLVSSLQGHVLFSTRSYPCLTVFAQLRNSATLPPPSAAIAQHCNWHQPLCHSFQLPPC